MPAIRLNRSPQSSSDDFSINYSNRSRADEDYSSPLHTRAARSGSMGKFAQSFSNTNSRSPSRSPNDVRNRISPKKVWENSPTAFNNCSRPGSSNSFNKLENEKSNFAKILETPPNHNLDIPWIAINSEVVDAHQTFSAPLLVSNDKLKHEESSQMEWLPQKVSPTLFFCRQKH